AVEYQGPVVRVAVTTEDGAEATAVVPDRDFYRSPLGPGDVATLSWPEHEAHKLLHEKRQAALARPWLLFISGWMRWPKFSTPFTKSSKVSITPANPSMVDISSS